MDLESEKLAYFTEDHVRMLGLLAPQIASSVENARLYEEINQREQRMEQDLKAARNLQQVLLPRKAPRIRGLEIAISGRPAREITGDVYDFFEQDSERQHAVLAFGDVSGKGAAAALYGALVSGLLRILAPVEAAPSKLLQTLNETLMERKVDAQYATLMILLWDSARRRFTMANAGAEPAFICRRGEIIQPRVEGVPIGLLDNREYEEITFDAQPGDVILLFSDGLEDQLNPAEQAFGRVRIGRLLTKYCGLEPREVVAKIFEEMNQYMDGAPITDDQTAIVIRVS